MAQTSDFKNYFERDDVAKGYVFMEKLTGIPGKALLDQAGLKFTSATRILDNACGTGIITSLIMDNVHGDLPQIVAADASAAMVKSVAQRASTNKWTNVETIVADAQDTKLPDTSIDCVVTNFAIFALPEPMAALKDQFRVLKSDGVLAFTTWQSLGWFPDVDQAARDIPDAPPLPNPASIWKKTGPWEDPAFVKSQVEEAGFQNIKVTVHPCEIVVDDISSYVKNMSVFITYLIKSWPEEAQQSAGPQIAVNLERNLRAKYANSTYILRFVALLVTGRKP